MDHIVSVWWFFRLYWGSFLLSRSLIIIVIIGLWSLTLPRLELSSLCNHHSCKKPLAALIIWDMQQLKKTVCGYWSILNIYRVFQQVLVKISNSKYKNYISTFTIFPFFVALSFVYYLTTRWRLSWVFSYVKSTLQIPNKIEFPKKYLEFDFFLALNKSFEH